MEQQQTHDCAGWDSCPNPAEHAGPLADVTGELGVQGRRLVAALNPHPRNLAAVETIVTELVERLEGIHGDDPEAEQILEGIVLAVEQGMSRVSALPMLPPRGDQHGERIAGRSEPRL